MAGNVQRTETGRKASKEFRRQQLIDATIKVLAQKGYATLTVADVARQAGLSTGIIIFHFVSKDELLASVLRFLAEEYYHNWKEALAGAGNSADKRLAALTLSDFNSAIYTQDKLSAWIAFWGETQGRPIYDRICGAFDIERTNACIDCCKALIEAEGYQLDPRMTAQALDALGDGLWLGVVSAGGGQPGQAAATDALNIMQSALAAYFPRHFAMPKI